MVEGRWISAVFGSEGLMQKVSLLDRNLGGQEDDDQRNDWRENNRTMMVYG